MCVAVLSDFTSLHQNITKSLITEANLLVEQSSDRGLLFEELQLPKEQARLHLSKRRREKGTN